MNSVIEYKINDVFLLQDNTCFVELKNVKVQYGQDFIESVLPISFIVRRDGKCLNVGELVSIKNVAKGTVMFASQSIGYFLCFEHIKRAVEDAAFKEFDGEATQLEKSDCEQLHDEIMQWHQQQAIDKALANNDAQAFYAITRKA